jgi:hypothetical protein
VTIRKSRRLDQQATRRAESYQRSENKGEGEHAQSRGLEIRFLEEIKVIGNRIRPTARLLSLASRETHNLALNQLPAPRSGSGPMLCFTPSTGKTRTLQAPERPSLPRVPRPNDSTDRPKTEGPSLTVREMRAIRTHVNIAMTLEQSQTFGTSPFPVEFQTVVIFLASSTRMSWWWKSLGGKPVGSLRHGLASYQHLVLESGCSAPSVPPPLSTKK